MKKLLLFILPIFLLTQCKVTSYSVTNKTGSELFVIVKYACDEGPNNDHDYSIDFLNRMLENETAERIAYDSASSTVIYKLLSNGLLTIFLDDEDMEIQDFEKMQITDKTDTIIIHSIDELKNRCTDGFRPALYYEIEELN